MATAQAESKVVMDEPLTSDFAATMLTGMFVDIDAIHRSSGSATIIEMEDGTYVLRLEDDFTVTRGPDLHVMLSGEAEPRNPNGVMAEPHIYLGQLKGNMGLRTTTFQQRLTLAA